MGNIVNGYNIRERTQQGQEWTPLDWFLFHRAYCEPRNTCNGGRSILSAMKQAKAE